MGKNTSGIKQRVPRGFTIVELLIVIVVIGVLAAITVVAFNGVQERARVTSIVDSFRKVEKSLRLWTVDRGDRAWPNDNTVISGVSNPSLTQLINSANLGPFLQSSPQPPGTGGVWLYDNDQDTYNGCTAGTTGVNIGLQNFTDSAMAQKVDAAMDDGNVTCGKVRWDGNQIILSLSANGAL